MVDTYETSEIWSGLCKYLRLKLSFLRKQEPLDLIQIKLTLVQLEDILAKGPCYLTRYDFGDSFYNLAINPIAGREQPLQCFEQSEENFRLGNYRNESSRSKIRWCLWLLGRQADEANLPCVNNTVSCQKLPPQIGFLDSDTLNRGRQMVQQLELEDSTQDYFVRTKWGTFAVKSDLFVREGYLQQAKEASCAALNLAKSHDMVSEIRFAQERLNNIAYIMEYSLTQEMQQLNAEDFIQLLEDVIPFQDLIEESRTLVDLNLDQDQSLFTEQGDNNQSSLSDDAIDLFFG